MIKSKEIAGPSCLTSAQDDEPVFVLRANDEIGAFVVRFWAMRYFKQKSKQPGGITPKQRKKHYEAIGLAGQMDRWRAQNRREQVSAMTGHPVESVDQLIVDGVPQSDAFSEKEVVAAFFADISKERLDALMKVCQLSSELCNSLDAADEDIGGHRPANEIVAELGPVVDAWEGR